MADTKIDKSLDDIIKERRINTRNGGRGGARGGRGGSGRGGPGGRFRGSPAGGGNRFGRRPNSGAVSKRRSGGGSPNKASASINGHWNHDLYQNGGGRRNAAIALATGIAGGTTGPAKLIISNLDFGVNDSDIKGLFQEFGTIKKAAVHYDRSGRSLGTADVVFERKQDAIRALKKYDGVSLDGRPMNIQLTATLAAVPIAVPVPRAPSGGGFRRGGRGMGGRGGPRRGGAPRGGAGAPRTPKSNKSAADLDAELDAYNAKMQTD